MAFNIGQALGQAAAPATQGRKTYADGSYSVPNANGTWDLYNADGSLRRQGASAPQGTEGFDNRNDSQVFDVADLVNAGLAPVTGGTSLIPGSPTGIPGSAAQGAADAATNGDSLIEGTYNGIKNDPSVQSVAGTVEKAADAIGDLGGGGKAHQVDYGRDPLYRQQTIDAERSAALGQQSALTGIGQRSEDSGSQFGTQAASFGQRGSEVGAMGQRDLNADAALAQARGASLGAGLTGLEATEGPSAAQAQLQSATSQGMNDALTMARSGRGLGGSAASLGQAGRALPGMAANAANQSAALRAQENAAWRSRQGQNMTNAAGIEQQGISQGIGARQAGIGAAQAGTAQGMQGASTGGQLTLAGQGQNAAATQAGADQYWKGEQNANAINTTQGQLDLGVETANAGQPSMWPALIGAGATGLAMAASDERNKNVGNEVKLSSAIHGNPYGRTGAPGKGFAMPPIRSDENSKNKIAELESQLAAARQGLSGPAATEGARRGDVDTDSLDAVRGRGSAPDFSQSPNYAYTYKDPTIPGAAPGTQVGPMAQDLERAGSQAVVDTPTGKMVDPGRVAMETAGAVGELQGENQDLKRQFAELEAMLRSDVKKKPRVQQVSP